jgi:hypothetical protein
MTLPLSSKIDQHHFVRLAQHPPWLTPVLTMGKVVSKESQHTFKELTSNDNIV